MFDNKKSKRKANTIKYHFFLSYANSDYEKVNEYYEMLKKHFKIIFAPKSIECGQQWDLELKNFQRKCLTTLVFYSKSTHESYYQREEITLAIKYFRAGERSIIPIQLEEGAEFPFGLNIIQGINYSQTINNIELLKILTKHIEQEFPKRLIDKYLYKPSFRGLSQFENLSDREGQWYTISEPKRILIQAQIEESINKFLKTIEPNCKIQIVYIDIDDFKKINGKYNIEVAENILKEVGTLIKRISPAFFTRLVGDEFLIFFSHNNFDNIYNEVSILYNHIRNHNWDKIAFNLFVNISIGISQFDCTDNNMSIESSRDLRKGIMKAIYGCKVSKKSKNKINEGPIFIEDKDYDTIKQIWDSGS